MDRHFETDAMHSSGNNIKNFSPHFAFLVVLIWVLILGKREGNRDREREISYILFRTGLMVEEMYCAMQCFENDYKFVWCMEVYISC